MVYWVECPVLNPKDGSLTTTLVPMVMPHELLFLLWHMSQPLFKKVMGCSGLERFWKLFGEGAEQHPHFQGTRCEYIIPFRLWGDDSAHSRTDSFEAVTMTSAVHFGVSHWVSRLLLAMVSLKNAVKQTHQRLYSYLVWSFTLCSTGKMPAEDLNGNTWAARGQDGDAWRASVAGLDICGDYTALFWELSGDLKWQKEALDLPYNYSKAECCGICTAVSIDTTNDGNLECSCLNFDCEAEMYHTQNLRTQADLILWFTSRGLPVPALIGAPGFDIQRTVVLDLQHCHALGLCHRCCGNLIVFLAENNYFGTFPSDFDTRMTLRLRRAYSEFCKWTKQHGQQCFGLTLR